MKRRIFVLLAALCLCLSGCGYPELYERVLIHGIGVDWTGEGYRVTVRSSTSAEEGEELFTCEGETVLEALSSLSLTTGREPFYAHNYLVVFGMDCARRGLDGCLDFFVRYYNTRPAVELFVAEGTAEEVLSTEKDGKLMRMSELEALGSGGRWNGQAVDMDILGFVNGMRREGSSAVLPLLRAGEDSVEAAGTVYFSGAQQKGLLTLEQTRGYLAMTNKLNRGELAVEAQNGVVTLSLRGIKTKTQARAGDPPSFRVQMEVAADVSAADTSGLDCAYLEAAAAEKLRNEAEAAVRQAVVGDGCDIFGFGNQLYREQPSYWRANGARWPELMGRSQYQIEVKVKVQRLEEERVAGAVG